MKGEKLGLMYVCMDVLWSYFVHEYTTSFFHLIRPSFFLSSPPPPPSTEKQSQNRLKKKRKTIKSIISTKNKPNFSKEAEQRSRARKAKQSTC